MPYPSCSDIEDARKLCVPIPMCTQRLAFLSTLLNPTLPVDRARGTMKFFKRPSRHDNVLRIANRPPRIKLSRHAYVSQLSLISYMYNISVLTLPRMMNHVAINFSILSSSFLMMRYISYNICILSNYKNTKSNVFTITSLNCLILRQYVFPAPSPGSSDPPWGKDIICRTTAEINEFTDRSQEHNCPSDDCAGVI